MQEQLSRGVALQEHLLQAQGQEEVPAWVQ
jgi:hypothetical protein